VAQSSGRWVETRYSSAFWGTYQQWQELGGQVRKGEHGSPVVYCGTYERQAGDDEGDKTHRGLFAKGYTVFDIEQVDGCKLPKRFEPKLSHPNALPKRITFSLAWELRGCGLPTVSRGGFAGAGKVRRGSPKRGRRMYNVPCPIGGTPCR